jgi:hypothetical protein
MAVVDPPRVGIPNAASGRESVTGRGLKAVFETEWFGGDRR